MTKHMKRTGIVEGVILGCAELPSLIRPEDSDVPLFDAARIHALAILACALQ